MRTFALQDIQIALPHPGGGRVVLVSWERLSDEETRQRNVFRLDEGGEIVWQVGDYLPMARSTFTNIYFDESGALMGYNFDGGEYEIDLHTGAIKSSRLIK